MSLRDLGVFNPLKGDHPLASSRTPCPHCGVNFGPGDRVALRPVQTPEEAGSLTVEAAPVHATCFLAGQTIRTPSGLRVVHYILCGDASPFPVRDTAGGQWRDEEVGP